MASATLGSVLFVFILWNLPLINILLTYSYTHLSLPFSLQNFLFCHTYNTTLPPSSGSRFVARRNGKKLGTCSFILITAVKSRDSEKYEIKFVPPYSKVFPYTLMQTLSILSVLGGQP